MTDAQIWEAIVELLARGQPSATVCPSEVARVLAPERWRPLMVRVRAVALAMAAKGDLEIRQRGAVVAPDAPLRGPIRLASPIPRTAGHPTTPDGRYFVVRGRLWRKSNPHLAPQVREALVSELMAARRALRRSLTEEERRAVRGQVDQAKRALGERGPVWWTDGAPDYNRKLATNTPYRDWFLGLPPQADAREPRGATPPEV